MYSHFGYWFEDWISTVIKEWKKFLSLMYSFSVDLVGHFVMFVLEFLGVEKYTYFVII